ncbi:hypothetical protein GCM10020331_075080 [Ectobacillus funiculus]
MAAIRILSIQFAETNVLLKKRYPFYRCRCFRWTGGRIKGTVNYARGQKEAYEHVKEMLEGISAKVDGEPCCAYVGPDGAGHYVKKWFITGLSMEICS